MGQQERRSFQEWCVEQHRKTNHLYDKIIPYEFHLGMVVREIKHHYKIGQQTPSTPNAEYNSRLGLNIFSEIGTLIDGGWGHDIIEDTRNTYNDVRDAGCSYEAAEIIYACTDDKGKDRAERGSDKHGSGESTRCSLCEVC